MYPNHERQDLARLDVEHAVRKTSPAARRVGVVAVGDAAAAARAPQLGVELRDARLRGGAQESLTKGPRKEPKKRESAEPKRAQQSPKKELKKE